MTTETPGIVDALPYIDTAIDDDDEQRAIAMGLIDDEIEIFPPDKDYLDYLPSINNRPFCTTLLDQEHNHIEHKIKPPLNDLAEIKLSVPPPTQEGEEVPDWTECLNKLKIKLEYCQRQMMNLELIKSYGSSAWEQYLLSMERIESDLKTELSVISKSTQEINWKRKSDQERVAKVLDVLNNEWNSFADKNHELFIEMRKLNPQF